jgi:uncharacterized coiled-coil protein SlyX
MENKVSNDHKLSNEKAVETSKLDSARKEGVTKGALTTGIISLVILIAFAVLGYVLYKKEQKVHFTMMEDQKYTFTEQLNVRDSTINDWLKTFDEIEQNLNMIKEKILEDMRYINTLIDENKKKIAQLNSQLKKSGVTIKGLEERIAGLEETMKQYESEITDLKNTLANKDFEIVRLNENVVALNDTISHKNETITRQTNKLNQAFLVSGTYKDLKEKGILVKEGGFLGLGRNEMLVDDISDTLFTEVDITSLTTIPVNSKKVRLISEHPTGSYEMVKENEKQVAYIAIKNPEEFWKISRYAVVEITK